MREKGINFKQCANAFISCSGARAPPTTETLT
jgi:hypothetical protein